MNQDNESNSEAKQQERFTVYLFVHFFAWQGLNTMVVSNIL